VARKDRTECYEILDIAGRFSTLDSCCCLFGCAMVADNSELVRKCIIEFKRRGAEFDQYLGELVISLPIVYSFLNRCLGSLSVLETFNPIMDRLRPRANNILNMVLRRLDHSNVEASPEFIDSMVVMLDRLRMWGAHIDSLRLCHTVIYGPTYVFQWAFKHADSEIRKDLAIEVFLIRSIRNQTYRADHTRAVIETAVAPSNRHHIILYCLDFILGPTHEHKSTPLSWYGLHEMPWDVTQLSISIGGKGGRVTMSARDALPFLKKGAHIAYLHPSAFVCDYCHSRPSDCAWAELASVLEARELDGKIRGCSVSMTVLRERIQQAARGGDGKGLCINAMWSLRRAVGITRKDIAASSLGKRKER
jgi:hypothetical protein